jgi:hypothetical protein
MHRRQAGHVCRGSFVNSDKPIVCVTKGGIEGHSVDSGLPQGVSRAVRSEVQRVRICLIATDREASTDDIAALVKNIGEGFPEIEGLRGQQR